MNHIIIDRTNDNFIMVSDDVITTTYNKPQQNNHKGSIELNKGLLNRINSLQLDLKNNEKDIRFCKLEYTINNNKLYVYPIDETFNSSKLTKENNIISHDIINNKTVSWSQVEEEEIYNYTIERKIKQFKPHNGNMKIFYSTLNDNNFIIAMATNKYKKLIISIDKINEGGFLGYIKNQNNTPVLISEMWPELDLLAYSKFNSKTELLIGNDFLDTINNDLNVENSIIQLSANYNNQNIVVSKKFENKMTL
jgi:hypothetical protein